MVSEYLYGDLPEFDAGEFDQILREHPKHKVKHNFMELELNVKLSPPK
ncbi:MAG: hypothetical protein OIN89_06150 [Candidatus Methanoperedens sp.]|jgi:hypothetical protein|nr:hypothetical protein [Candidatus Methanoperedens sp.]